MKYCPKCGNLIDGKFECSCGWKAEEIILSDKIGIINSDFKTGMLILDEIKEREYNITSFLIEAKKQTYANSSADKIPSSRLNSKDYEYKKNNMIYHDTYFGGTNFIGEELVYVDEQPYWGMNYYGVTLDKSLGEEAMDNALRPALMKVGEDITIIPVRGPKKFINGDYIYTFDVDGDIENFNGVETVYKNDIKIYELKCSGGLIK